MRGYGIRWVKSVQNRLEGTGIVGTRTVPVSGSGKPIFKVPEQERFMFQEVGNQMYKVLERRNLGSPVKNCPKVYLTYLSEPVRRGLILIDCDICWGLVLLGFRRFCRSRRFCRNRRIQKDLESRNYQLIKVFQHCSTEVTKMEPT